MKTHNSRIGLWGAALGILGLILDSRCSTRAMEQGLSLCFRTVIPSLFPLFVLSAVLVPRLSQLRFPGWLHRGLGIPAGTEGIFLLGAVGGFPLGARCLAQAAAQGTISRRDAQRMLGLCNQCGIAFLFGILPGIFSDPRMALCCFLIQLLSAVTVAMLSPPAGGRCAAAAAEPVSLSQAVPGAVRSMANVCGWILTASVLIGFLQKWLFPLLPQAAAPICTGFLELTAGCLALRRFPADSIRLILCCAFLCFGGVSVLLQIAGTAAPAGLSMRPCIRAKLCQALLGAALAAAVCRYGMVFLLLPIPAAYFCKKQWLFLRSCGIIPLKREVSDHVVS